VVLVWYKMSLKKGLFGPPPPPRQMEAPMVGHGVWE